MKDTALGLSQHYKHRGQARGALQETRHFPGESGRSSSLQTTRISFQAIVLLTVYVYLSCKRVSLSDDRNGASL